MRKRRWGVVVGILPFCASLTLNAAEYHLLQEVYARLEGKVCFHPANTRVDELPVFELRAWTLAFIQDQVRIRAAR